MGGRALEDDPQRLLSLNRTSEIGCGPLKVEQLPRLLFAL
jgi:hypothetical protein